MSLSRITVLSMVLLLGGFMAGCESTSDSIAGHPNLLRSSRI